MTDVELSRTFWVGPHKVTLTVAAAGLRCVWHPCVPRKLTKAQRRRYLENRNASLAEFAKASGMVVAGIDAPNPLGTKPLLFHPNGRVEILDDGACHTVQ